MTHRELTVADIFDSKHEQEIWQDIFSSFQSSALMKRFKRKDSYLASYNYLMDILSGGAFSRQWENLPPTQAARPYFYDDLIGFEEKRAWPMRWLFAPRRISTASLFKEHLAHLKRQPMNRDRREMVERMDHALAVMPTLKQERAGRLTDELVRSVPLISKRSANPKDAYATAVVPDSYKPSYLKSVATSALLGGASRIAIMAAFGGLGMTGVGFAIAAGVGAGVVTSYYKNRDVIRREIAMESTFWGRMKARARGFRKSYSKTQFLLNVGASSLGVVGGGALFEAIAENVPMPKFAQDFAAAAQTQISTALEWGGEKASLAGTYLAGATEIAVANASSMLETAREVAADYNMMTHDPSLSSASGATEVLPIEPDPLMQYATMDGVIVLEDANPDASVENITQILPEEAAPDAVVPEPVSALPVDPVARAFAAAGATPQVDAQTVRWMENYAQAYAQASAPAPANDVLAYMADDLNGGSVVQDNQQATLSAENIATVPLNTHTIERGDTLWKLTREYYGFASTDGQGRWDAIAKIVQANPHLAGDPTALTVGDKLVMPDLQDPAVSSAECNIVRGRLRGGCTLAVS